MASQPACHTHTHTHTHYTCSSHRHNSRAVDRGSHAYSVVSDNGNTDVSVQVGPMKQDVRDINFTTSTSCDSRELCAVGKQSNVWNARISTQLVAEGESVRPDVSIVTIRAPPSQDYLKEVHHR